MKVIVACEFSGTVRDAFIKAGHDAVSVDLLASTSDFGPHILDDIRNVDLTPFDLMLAFPPCTHLAISGSRWFEGKETAQRKALEFVDWILNAPVPRLCMENPVGVISTHFRQPNQIIQPYHFGHHESKKTCLWLKGLPDLKATKRLPPGPGGVYSNQTAAGNHKMGPQKNRWKKRSTTYQGIADAMAAQWGVLDG